MSINDINFCEVVCLLTYKPNILLTYITLQIYDDYKFVFGCLSGPPGFTCWISFAPVFSFIYC